MLARRIPRLQSFEYHSHAYLDISVYFSLAGKHEYSPYTTESRYVYNVCQLLLRNRVAANGHGGSPSCLCRYVVALAAGGMLSCLHRSEVRQWGLSVYA